MSEIEGGGGSVEGGGSGEVSSSSEVNETSAAETGGESSEATQEATTEEAGESGGFDEDSDTTESPEDSAEDSDESEYDEEPDDSQEVGFSEGDDVENTDSQYDGSDYENDNTSSGDEDGIGFDDSDDDIGDGIDEDTDSDTDSSDSPMDENNDESFDEPNDYEDESSESDWDDQEDEDAGETEDYSDEESLDDNDTDDVQDDGEAEAEDTDSTADGEEADGDMDNDGEPDDAEADAEVDTEDGDDIDDDWDDQEDEDVGEPEDYSDEDSLEDSTDDVQDDGEAEAEDTDSTADGEEADGEPDGSEADAEDDTEDDDYDEDPGELEDYSDEDADNRNENHDSTDDSESEREQEEEEQAAEEENQNAAERAEDETESADVHNADNNIDDAAESENRNPSENGTEQQNEPAEIESTQTADTENEELRNDAETQNDSADNKNDSFTDTHDQNEEQPDDTNSRMENKAETPEGEDAYRTAMNNMAEYMSEHNYGPDDYAEYSQDPEWQKLNADLQQSLGMDVTTDVSTPSLESGKDVSAAELPDNCVMVNASDIDMTYAQGMDSDQFWNHHGNTKEDYMRIAEGIPDVQQALDSGKSLDEIKQDPDLKDTAHAYFDPENMVKVEQQADGSYSFADDGRHRIAAAQEMGYEIPVEVTNMPEKANAATTDNADMKPEDTTRPEDVANKSDISDETRENLGAFEQNNWDNLSQVEKEQAIEKLRDSIAEDLQLENKPNIAYYNNEDPGDYGGYAASNNTIYINRFNMGDAAETADTIAHESRHCWQHERADNPQTEQDYQFKENFDDYVRPEDDFYEYQNQPVEADARDYAQDVKDAIPVSDETPDMEAKQDYEGSDHKSNNDAPPSTTGPPETVNEKAEPTQVPEDLDRKVDIPDEQKIADVNKNIADISEDPSLDSREKAEKIAKELNSIGFDKVDETTVLGFTDQKIEVVQMDGSQELYRRGYDTEGQGGYGYGSWWSEEPMSIEDTRNKLAVCESWGNPLTGEYQSKPENGTLALKGTAAPQDTPTKDGGVEHRDGGATQYYIETPNKNWCNKVNQEVR